MTEHSFSLLPFPAPNLPEIAVTGQISRQNNLLDLHYSLTGNLEEIFLPPRTTQPRRKAELWKSTCFEFFLARKDQPPYWEFNMSPSGDWNVFRMDAYRRLGFREETSVQWLRFEMQKSATEFGLHAEADLNCIFQANDNLEAGITTVIQTKDGNESYWALSHPAPDADFHWRGSFILALVGQTQPLRQSALGG